MTNVKFGLSPDGQWIVVEFEDDGGRVIINIKRAYVVSTYWSNIHDPPSVYITTVYDEPIRVHRFHLTKDEYSAFREMLMSGRDPREGD